MSDTSKRLAGLSPERLALLVRQFKKDSAAPAPSPERVVPRPRVSASLPLSFAQQRLWFIQQLAPEATTYNVPAAVRLKGRLNVSALGQSLAAIVERHESLRASFPTVAGEPVQLIAPALTPALPITDLGRLPEAEREAEAQRLINEEARRPFDLSAAPLLRAGLIRLGEEEHLFLFTIHHIISDGWSVGVLVRELSALYNSLCEGGDAALPALPVQYGDYVQWQHEWLRGEVLEKQFSYWRRQLDGAPALMALPTDRPRPPVQGFRGAVHNFSLPAALAKDLSALSRRHGATLFMTTLAAFEALLLKWTGQRDLVVGTPVANRPQAELEGLIGFFANTLVLRADLSSDPPFRELLARVRETTLDAYAHQDVPFEKLVEELRPERSLSHNPVFQVMFILQNARPDRFSLAGLTSSPAGSEVKVSVFDLTLMLEEHAESLSGALQYNTELFDAATVERMAGHFQSLLESIVADPSRRLSELKWLTDAERHQLLAEFNDTAKGQPTDACAHELFEAQAARTPGATALVFADQSLSYAELNGRANQLAHHLRSLGVGPDVLVGICADRSAELVVALLGVMKAGGAYLPLDAGYPQERLAYMLEDARPRVLLTQQHLLAGLPAHGAAVLCLDSDWHLVAGFSAENPDGGAGPEHLAYVIYTSGSTGRPKGVALAHRGLSNLWHEQARAFGLAPTDRVLQFASLSFDAFTFELVMALLTGAALYVAPKEMLLPGEALATFLREHEISNIVIPPSALALTPEGGLPGLKRVVVAGEACPAELVARWGAGRRFFNAYGPTETTIWASVDECRAGDGPPTVGRPIGNARIYILDEWHRLAPVGVAGELCIGGVGLARGYLNRPELTAEKFIPDPFGPEPGARLYRTGDLARYLADGRLEFLGRLDHQVKLRGFRIEPGEVEAALREHPRVRESVVLVREDDPGDQRLVAYVATGEGGASAGELRALARSRLPEYMVPSAFVALDALPLTPNGKVDRKALPAPGRTHEGAHDAPVAPRTEVERAIAGVWQEVLKLESVGRHDNFFDLGGHSLLMPLAQNKLRERLGREVSVIDLFKHPTVGSLAKCLSEEEEEQTTHEQRQTQAQQRKSLTKRRQQLRTRHRAVSDGLDEAEADDHSQVAARTNETGAAAAAETAETAETAHAEPPPPSPAPLSPGQHRLWLAGQLDPENSFHNVGAALTLKGKLDVAALERSFDEIVRRHEVLRTSFAGADGTPCQAVAPPTPLSLPVIDLTAVAYVEREATARRHVEEETRRPFDLSRGPLFRVRLLKLGREEHILIVLSHIGVCDAVSLDIILRELTLLYEAHAGGRPSPLPELTSRFGDFARRQHEWMSGPAVEEQLDYWKRTLAGLPERIKLPLDRPRPPVRNFKSARAALPLPASLTESLKELSRREQVTMYMTTLAALGVLLGRHGGQTEAVVATPVANRVREETRGLVGFFANTVLLRTDLSGDPTFRELLRRVRDVALGAFAHQELPFEKLLEALPPADGPAVNPLHQVIFTFHQTPPAEFGLPGLTTRVEAVNNGATAFDLKLTVVLDAEPENGDAPGREAGMTLVCKYDADLFEKPTIGRLLSDFRRLLEGAAAGPERRLSELLG